MFFPADKTQQLAAPHLRSGRGCRFSCSARRTLSGTHSVFTCSFFTNLAFLRSRVPFLAAASGAEEERARRACDSMTPPTSDSDDDMV